MPTFPLGSPPVEFYATKPEQPSHPQEMKRFFNAVAVRSGSTVTLTCTAKQPQGLPSSFGPYLQPYMINWFVNSSKLTQVSGCDSKPHKTKTCSLLLVNIKPRDNGKYFCQAANDLGCTYKQLRLTVTNGKKLSFIHWLLFKGILQRVVKSPYHPKKGFVKRNGNDDSLLKMVALLILRALMFYFRDVK